MDNLKELLRPNFQNSNGVSEYWLEKRKQSANTIENNSIPTKRMEEWKYSDVSYFLDKHFANLNNLDQDLIEQSFSLPFDSHIVHLNDGKMDYKSSVDGGEINKAVDVNNESLERFFDKKSSGFDTVFDGLSLSGAENGAFITIGEKKLIDQPIVLVNSILGNNAISNSKTTIVVKDNAQATLIFLNKNVASEHQFANVSIDCHIGKNARLAITLVQNEASLSEITKINAFQQSNSVFETNTITLNGGFLRNDLNIKHEGEHIESFLNGLFIVNGNTHVDNHTLVDHALPNSESNELYKGVLDDKATGVFNGKVYVREDAQKTNAYQQNRNILLSDDAVINTKPQLEIWADDVKCSHGATVGQLDERQLFYLKARGIGKELAQRLMIYAFASEVVERITNKELRSWIQTMVKEKLNFSLD